MIWTLALLAVLALVPPPSQAASPVTAPDVGVLLRSSSGAAKATRQCRSQCGAKARTCLAMAAERRPVLQAACTGAERRPCRGRVRLAVQRARKACRTFRTECVACCKSGGSGPTCPVGDPVPFTPPPLPDLGALGLPQQEDGSYLILALPGGSLGLDADRRDALTAVGVCVRSIALCVAPPARSLDDCARSAPPCVTDRPWEESQPCCPAECFERYQGARRGGLDAVAAFRSVYIRDAPACVPGLGLLLTEGRP